MRKLYLLVFLSVSCLSIVAQNNFDFYEDRIDCGTVRWKEPVTATFTLVNNSGRTVTITQVHPDCSCTAVSWTQSAIAPGAKAEVRVTYDAELLGTFQKQVAVYTSLSSRPIYATMRGRVMLNAETFAPVVEPEPEHNEEDFNYTIGSIHLSEANLEFDDVQLGDTPIVTLRLLNASDEVYTPQVMHLPSWLSVAAIPETIRPGHTGELLFRLRSREVGDFGLTQRSIYLARFPGDVVGQDNELTVSATVLPRRLTSLAGPVPTIQCDTLVQLGRFAGKEQLKTTLVLHNVGSAPLEIGKLQVYNPGILVSLSTTRIKAAGKAKLTITGTPSIFDHHGRHRILLITNDPQHPKVIIEVVAEK